MNSGKARLGDLSAVKLALMAKKVRADAQDVLRADPIAIIGIAVRVPGGGDTPEGFWQLLSTGTDAVREVPRDRWDGDAWFDPDPAVPGKALTKWGGFLDAVDAFDAAYFGIVPREAERMDPQQRLFLEVATEAIDDAGLSRERLAGTRASVYVASYHNDYTHLQHADLEALDSRTLTGTLHSVLTNRLSYLLDLRGPSVSIDTACSSSLVATHLACQSLRDGESDLSIAGGVSLMITPEMMVSLSKVGFMAPDGRSKTFDARADGFGRGEGCGVVVLKRLSDAIADGDRVHAVIRGSVVNSDGHSTILSAPNGLAQKAMILEALETAQLDARRIGFVETHGTGTSLGDPIEVEAIANTVGKAAEGAGTCWLGAVKANLGHLEAAAGIVGLIKTILVLRNEAVPPQVHFSKLSPHISIEGTRLAVPTKLVPWPRGSVVRCAGVSAFGVGGTNAHVIVEEAPRLPAAEEESPDVERILPLSAQSPEALRALVDRWARFLRESDASIVDLCFTAAERRTHHGVRLAVVGRTKEDLAAALAQRETASVRASAGEPAIGFVFSGQGPQWYAMGRELLASEPVFHDVIAECDALLRPLAGWSLLEELARPEAESRLNATDIAQPALFAVQVALAALWRSWGVVPAGVVGHSVGEIAALHVAGVLGLEEAVRVVHQRGLIMHQATGLGRMAQVALSEAEALAVVAPYGDRLSVGAVNGPRNVVLSGEAAALEPVLKTLAERGVTHRMLPVEYAFHSAQMAPFQARLAEVLAGVKTSPPKVPVYSTVTGALAQAGFDATYFGRNVREQVRFSSAIGAMSEDGFDVFLEIGPHPVLAAPITETVEASSRSARVLASLRRTRPERETMLRACAGLYEAGVTPAWEAFQQAYGQVVSLPTYPWQRQRYWIRSRPSARLPKGKASGHLLLGQRVEVAGERVRIFEASSADAPAWLRDHRIFDRLPIPAAAVLDAFAAAAADALGKGVRVDAFSMDRPLFLPEGDGESTRWQFVVSLSSGGRAELELHESHGQAWQKVASASADASANDASAIELGKDAEAIERGAFYDRFAALGVAFGPAFRCLASIRRDGVGVAEALLELPPGLEPSAAIHPVLLDAALQLCSVAAERGPGGELPAAVVLPLGVERFEAKARAHARLLARARVRRVGEDGASLAADITLDAPDGARVATLSGVRFARADASVFASRARAGNHVFDVLWERESASEQPASAPGAWLLFVDRAGVGDALAKELAAKGGRCARVRAGKEFLRTATDEWVVDPARPEQMTRLLGEAGFSSTSPVRGVVHLWNLDLAPLDARKDDAAEEDILGTASLLHLSQALVRALAGAASSLVVVTRGARATGSENANGLRPRGAGAWGLASVVALEHPELHVRRVDLDPTDSSALPAGLFAEVVASGETTTSVALRGGARWVERLAGHREDAAAATGEPLRLELVRPGTLDGAELRPRSRAKLRSGEVRLRVLASGINFRDVLLTLGAYAAAGVPLGAECVGIVTEVAADVREFELGARVFGYVPGSLATEVTVPAAFLAKVPAPLGAEEAAGMPVAFLTAYYGLHRLAKLEAGERVLIHAAAGGVGLAAVQLAQAAGAEIFATAGSEEKRALLRSLGVRHVMDSRSLAFEGEIRTATNGAGVHLVLNSLAGEFIPASLRTLATGGRFLELGKRDIMTKESAAQVRPDVSYWAYDLGSEAEANHALLRPMFGAILEGLASGKLRPLPVKVYALEEAAEAFRFMAQAKHVGKIVVRPRAAQAIVRSDATYWITGGLGALGLETARWLVGAGAKSVVLTARHAPSAAAAETIRELEASGATVTTFQADASNEDEMAKVLAAVDARLPPLRGVIHAAGTVSDALLLEQSWERSREVLRGKAHGAWILHELTRTRPLDLFVLYSAAGVFLGAPGQGLYPAANAEIDELARTRRALGLPALSVAWGAWAGGMAGALAANGRDVWAERGLTKIAPADAFAKLETLLRDGTTYAAIAPIRWPTFLARLSPRADRAFFRAFDDGGTTPTRASVQRGSDLAERLRAMPSGQRRPMLMVSVTERALHVLALDPSTPVDPKVPLKALGLDSLMAVELRNALARALGKALPPTLLFDYPTVDGLATFLLRTLDLEEAPKSVEQVRSDTMTNAVAELTELTDEEAEALLLQELEEGGSSASCASSASSKESRKEAP